jgi:hypothetical protein
MKDVIGLLGTRSRAFISHFKIGTPDGVNEQSVARQQVLPRHQVTNALSGVTWSAHDFQIDVPYANDLAVFYRFKSKFDAIVLR